MTASELWNATKWSNQNKDGSISMSRERVLLIDKLLNKEK